MLTEGDIKILRELLSTKQDLQELRYEFNEKFQRILDGLDKVYGELKDFRQEQTFHTQKHMEVDEKLDSQDSRLAALESSPAQP